MGLCSSKVSEGEAGENAITPKGADVVVAILGTGGVGKSTLFKQVKTLTNQEYTLEEKMQFMPYIVFNVMGAIKALKELVQVNSCGDYAADPSDATVALIEAFPAQHWRTNSMLADADKRAGVLATIAEAWTDPALRDAWALISREKRYVGWTAVDELAPQLLDHVDAICAAGYQPPNDHLLLLRRQSKGIESLEFDHERKKVKLVDLGGQIAERQMWEMHLQQCSCVIWMVALSDYNRVSKEGGGENCLRESMRIFDDIAKEKTFRGLPFILLFNKDDVFQEKHKKQPLSDITSFDGFRGSTCEDAYRYIAGRFEGMSEDNSHYSTTFRTCATDTKVVSKIWASMLMSICGSNLQQSGLLS